MSTARDLARAALSLPAERAPEQGDLSLALAGAEAADLLKGGALTLVGDVLVPGPPAMTGDRLLDQAAAALVRQEPYEKVEDWLWRRGNGLAAAYVDDLGRAEGIGHATGHGLRARFARHAPADLPVAHPAEEHRGADDPLVGELLAVLRGVDALPEEADEEAEEKAQDATADVAGDGTEDPAGDAVATVLAAVGDAVTDLEALRLRREVEDAAFDNMWRA
ncbi:Golgi phosphoprotein 3 (GPP34) [Actinacidiphila yanglinensis]|uniref:Golgi phosphoprotein 3 (GPP34) n=1 Tax=Actinacidiphila yanglinensis TaxID=310779 RepID=A0A1H6E3B5_9ACTN|nr:GPP34 family phosphoprotein [Actinacidiphila yanglinensis]SEG92122.1 Golgi phosphoprotein 3 (GPP34) [Actinacidiphila yanglinensis]